ncbi:MAG: UDP-N-acetylmuramate--L-alanine ligase [Elusimicrobiota bacterium]|nr:UDP-N-acetylmuramate--L-alanine ligase [Endomicrobiia bacterium]MDW8166006.1 UDP-N-acetylmuramate--L-alanine ligase [Elusimicrobiota bacterium]
MDFFNKVRKIHLVGIGGSGMSGVAEVLLNMGYEVSGSDIKESETINRLKKLGAKIFIGHKRENINSADVVVFSSAIDKNNPELLEAKKKSIQIIPRIEMLAEIARMKYTISICGTHGKTTTTSMLGLVLKNCGFDPTIVVGGKFKNIGAHGRLGKGKFIVVESDESDGSFLKLSPYVVICTNIDNDHLDYYKNLKSLKDAFLQHFNSVPFYGFNILYGDDKNISSLLSFIKRKYYTYGINHRNDFYVEDIEMDKCISKFKVFFSHKYIGEIKLRILGLHNILNSLAVVSFSVLCDFNFKDVKLALEEFIGVERRIEFKGKIRLNNKEIEIYDDYGHHPKEIYYTLKALQTRVGNKKIIVLFQPHRYTRTKLLYKEFYKGFSKKHKIFLLDIYPANEKPIKGVSSKLIYQDLKNRGYDVEEYNEEKFLNFIENYKKDFVILTLGAGNVYSIADFLIKKYG